MKIRLPYGKRNIVGEVENERVRAVLQCSVDSFGIKSEIEIVEDSLKEPIGTKSLAELAIGKRHIVIVASDHTRPVPSKIILPAMLKEIKKNNDNCQITVLIATGCHRATTYDELKKKFGSKLIKQLNVVIHDCELDEFVDLGILPSGAPCMINQLAIDADLLIAEGFIEPHFFAGYSGGRKSVLPGIASKRCVLENHCFELIDSPNSRCGVLKDNPIHMDMTAAARKAKLAFIVNVVLDENQKVIASFAGDVIAAHEKGCAFVEQRCSFKPIMSDIVIASNNGYPMDQNLYQSVKGLSTAAETCKKHGVLIMACQCADGIGGEAFYQMFAECESVEQLYQNIGSIPAKQTKRDQWQAQILARILIQHEVIMISDLDDECIKAMHMTPAHSLDEAIALASKRLGQSSTITIIPEGISIIIKKS